MSVSNSEVQPATPPPPGFFQRLKTLFAPSKAGAPTAASKTLAAPAKKTSPRILLVLVLFALGTALLFFFKRRTAKRSKEDSNAGPVAPGVKQIRYWKQRADWDAPLTMTLIETSDGLRMLDEADMAGNGVVTVYLPKSHKGGKRCFSLVREKAIVYNRLSYEPLKTDCVTSYKIVKRDFKSQMPVTVSLRGLARDGFEGVIDYLKENHVLAVPWTGE